MSRIYTSSPPWRLHGVCRDSFTFYVKKELPCFKGEGCLKCVFSFLAGYQNYCGHNIRGLVCTANITSEQEYSPYILVLKPEEECAGSISRSTWFRSVQFMLQY
jgi:hypothetical protein